MKNRSLLIIGIVATLLIVLAVFGLTHFLMFIMLFYSMKTIGRMCGMNRFPSDAVERDTADFSARTRRPALRLGRLSNSPCSFDNQLEQFASGGYDGGTHIDGWLLLPQN